MNVRPRFKIPWFLNLIAVMVYAMLCVAFLAGYAGGSVRPGTWTWWLQLPAIVLPYTAIGLVISTPMLFLCRSRIMLSIHGMLIVLMLIRFTPIPGSWAPAEIAERPLRVLTFNAKEVYAGIDTEQATVQLIDAYRPDLVAIQGIPIYFRGDRTARTGAPLDGMRDRDRYVTTTPVKLDRDGFSSPVFVRNADASAPIRLIKQETYDLPGSKERVITRAELEWYGRRIAVYNFHLHSFSLKPWRRSRSFMIHIDLWRETAGAFRRDFITRSRQAEHVRRIIEREELPFIVCGDFNSTRHDGVYRHIAAGLSDVYFYGAVSNRATYHARYPFFRIDHILLSPQWQVHEAIVLPRTFSDHLPLTAVVSLAAGVDKEDD